jgi:hypothetical protein
MVGWRCSRKIHPNSFDRRICIVTWRSYQLRHQNNVDDPRLFLLFKFAECIACLFSADRSGFTLYNIPIFLPYYLTVRAYSSKLVK